MEKDVFLKISKYCLSLAGTVYFETNRYIGFKICGKVYLIIEELTNCTNILVRKEYVTDEESKMLNISDTNINKWNLDTELRINNDTDKLEAYIKIIEKAYNGTKDEYDEKVKENILEAINQKYDYIMEYANNEEYAFDKLLYKWNEFKEYKISNNELDELNSEIQALPKFQSQEILNNYVDNQVKYKFITIIYEMVSYIDDNAFNGRNYNEYEDSRRLASAGVRQNAWVKNFINYKKYSGDLSKIEKGVRNSISYIINPQKKMSVFKTSMLNQFCKYLKPGIKIENNYDLLCDMIYKYFEIIGIKIKNEKNKGIVYSRIMFTKIISKEWNVEKNYWKIQPYKNKLFTKDEVNKYLDNNVIVFKEKNLRESAGNNIFYATNDDNKALFLGMFTSQATDAGNDFYKREYKVISVANGDISILPNDKTWGSKSSTKLLIKVNKGENEDFECKVINGLFENDIEDILKEMKDITDENNVISIDYENIDNMVEEDEEMEDDEKYDTEIDTPLNLILYGPPGTGKTYNTVNYAVSIIEKKEIDEVVDEAKENRKAVFGRYKKYISEKKIVFTTFHQNYSYEEFIQGIRANTNNTDQLSFTKQDGIFKDLVERAKIDHENNYVIIIDEINRGNISRIFGELITLIEEDKRLGRDNETTVTLPSKEIFGVPGNIFIIGTMNTADKSIALIDIALRRRFDFIPMYPDYKIIPDFEEILRPINNAIYEKKRSADYLIGHAFFANKKLSDLENIVDKKLIPLLTEYFYSNVNDVKEVLSKGGIEVEMDKDTFQLKYTGVEA